MSDKKNMVDEGFELAAAICRLAGRPEYSSPDFGACNTDYHKEVAETFAAFADHAAVAYVKQNDFICFDKVFCFTVHITKAEDRFVFIDDINSLFDAGWNEENATEFLRLLNAFYVNTNYAAFYNAHIGLYEESTRKFVDEFYGKIDLEWFGKYVDSSNLRCILSLSSGNYGSIVNDRIIYCLVHGYGSNPPIVHEYCHSFANPLADKWYVENPDFKKWCDDSVNPKIFFYNSGQLMAYEYVTRAYNVLYEVQHGGDPDEWLAEVKNMGGKDHFIYIEQVYEMVLKMEKE